MSVTSERDAALEVVAPHARGMAMPAVADAVRAVLSTGATLHGWASAQPGARAMRGRGTSWAVSLGPERAVVRHSQHGGLLASLTGDLFKEPTRAPIEMANAARLMGAGVPTPAVLAYAVYPAGMGLARADVVTREVEGASDLLDVLSRVDVVERRRAVWPAVAGLLRALAAAGAWHPDLNAKNVLMVRGDGATAWTAWVLDTDVVTFERAGSRAVAQRNVARLERSLVKRADGFAAPLAPEDVAVLRASAEAFA
ncbi:MAG: hypothetical protein HY275_18755 [Gemmatimonadetes bacterium]|nr:hypothetical protein [Gemmatimonadota bacterium]